MNNLKTREDYGFFPTFVWKPEVQSDRELEDIFLSAITEILPIDLPHTEQDFDLLDFYFNTMLHSTFDRKSHSSFQLFGFRDPGVTEVTTIFLDKILTEKGQIKYFNLSKFQMVIQTAEFLFEMNQILWRKFPEEMGKFTEKSFHILIPLILVAMKNFQNQQEFLSQSENYLKSAIEFLEEDNWKSEVFSHYSFIIFSKNLIWTENDPEEIPLEEKHDYTNFILLALKTLLLNNSSEEFKERAKIANFFKDISLGNFLGFDNLNHIISRDYDHLINLILSSKMILEKHFDLKNLSIATIQTILDC